MQTLLRTPLHDRHVAAGARMVPFAGWEMPVQYEGVIQEHRAVRKDAGVFDVSHMGEIEVEGPRAHDLLQSLLSNDLDRIGVGSAQYTLLTNERGGIIDDLIVYRLDEFRYLLIVNASNREADYEWLKNREHRGSDVRDVSDDYALLAVQGPRAIERLGLPPAKSFTFDMAEIDGIEVMVNRTGYTGEDGCELMAMADDAVALWDAVLARSVVPCGLGARDTLRLEVCFPLHGNDITPDSDPISAGLGWACARHGLHRRRGAATDQGGGARAQARRVRDVRTSHPAPGNADRGRRRGHVRDALTDARPGDRARLCAWGARSAWDRAHDRRPGPAPERRGGQETHLQAEGAVSGGNRELSREPAFPP